MLRGKTGALNLNSPRYLAMKSEENQSNCSVSQVNKVPEEKLIWGFLRSLEVILMFDSYYKHKKFQCWGKSKVTDFSPPIVPEWHCHTPKHSLTLSHLFTGLLAKACQLTFCLFYPILSLHSCCTALVQLLIISLLCNCFSLPKGLPVSNLTLFSLLSTERK